MNVYNIIVTDIQQKATNQTQQLEYIQLVDICQEVFLLMTIGDKIKKHRTKLNIKKEKMAVDLSVSYSYLHALEHNQRTSVSQEMLIKIARYLKVSTDELLSLKPPPKQ